MLHPTAPSSGGPGDNATTAHILMNSLNGRQANLCTDLYIKQAYKFYILKAK